MNLYTLAIIFAAKYLIFIIAGLAFVFIAKQPQKSQKKILAYLLLTFPLYYFTAQVAGWLYYNPRPFMVEHIVPLVAHPPENGFPSSHTLLGAALAWTVLVYNKKWGIALGILAIIVGLARVAARVHHTIDIIGSIIIVAVIGFLIHKFVYRKIFRNEQMETNKPIPSTRDY